VQRTRRVRSPLRVGYDPFETAQDTDEVVIDDNPYHLVGAFHGPVSVDTRTRSANNKPDTPYEGGYYEVVCHQPDRVMSGIDC
jgi:hypothetical protein